MGTGEENPSTLSFFSPSSAAENSAVIPTDNRRSARWSGTGKRAVPRVIPRTTSIGNHPSPVLKHSLLTSRGPKLVVEEELKKGCCASQDTPCRWKLLSPAVCSALPAADRVPPAWKTSKWHLENFPLRITAARRTAPTVRRTEPNRGVSCASRRIKRGSTYPACLLEVSVFCRRNLHNHVFVFSLWWRWKVCRICRGSTRRVLACGWHGSPDFFFLFSFGVVFLEDGAVIMIVLL